MLIFNFNLGRGSEHENLTEVCGKCVCPCAKDMNTDMNADICKDSKLDSHAANPNPTSTSSSSYRSETKGEGSGSGSGITCLGDTYAIEIKPKQGWLQLASDVSDLFDLMPAGAEETTMDTTSDLNVGTGWNPSNLLPTGRGQHGLTLTPDKCRCRYCSMQLLKLELGKIKRLSNYCPLELFSGEIMALIKHLLVACLLREYNSNSNSNTKEEKQQQQQQEEKSRGQIHVASDVAFGCGMKTKTTATIEIGAANVDAAVATAWHEGTKQEVNKEEQQQLAGIVEFVKAVAGQPQRRLTTAAAAEKATQRCTKRCRVEATTTSPPATAITTTTETTTTCCESTSSLLSTNVAMAAATRTETETLTTTTTTMATPSLFSSLNPNETRAQINKAEIFHLPKNCVLQKILHLQLLVKRHFHYMWQTGQAEHATPSYSALRGLLSRCQQESTLDLALDNVDQLVAEQAYMLGATALDCSIMLTFQEIRCQSKQNDLLQPWLVTLQGRQFLTKLSVLDLDPKPDSHFHKFVKQMRQIEKCCRALN